MDIVKLIFLILLAILVIGALIELIVRLDIAEEDKQRRMALWIPPGSPEKPHERKAYRQ